MKNYMKDYPRPQMMRRNWENLNGKWGFSFDDSNIGEKEGWYKDFDKEMEINVPFTYETKLSGIGDESRHDYIWYQKTLMLDENQLKEKNIILHFEGSDFLTKVWVNGKMVGIHHGGYARFSFDITNFVINGENKIVVKVEDSYDMQQPRGKQRWKNENFGCWYVQTTGIWKTVWIETVSKCSIKKIKITPELLEESVDMEFNINKEESKVDLFLQVTIKFEETLINQVKIPVLENFVKTKINVFSQKLTEWGIKTWSPKEPNLYDVEICLVENEKVVDEVNSYFGMREIRIENGNILLNGVPLYQRLLLDQGYWKDSHLTPPDEEALIEDIEKTQELGYNGLRKHQKTEDERFLYWCDVKGMLVWSEFPATYQFSDYAISEFTKEWMEIVEQNYNHPSIITWTPFNESWGVPQIEVNTKQQQFTEAIYYLTKAFDKSRPVIVNDGWEHTISDIITLHDYEEVGEIFFERYHKWKDEILSTEVYHCSNRSAFANDYAYKGQPIIISEFGGIAFDNDKDGWGYGNKVETSEEFIKRFDEITSAIKALPYVCGYCYTQLSDVQQEINGLMDINRNFKIDPKKIKDINEKKIGSWRANHSNN